MKHQPQTILDAAVELFDSDGIGVSTAKVAAAAGVSNGTLFNYFPTKQDLLDAIYLDVKLELADHVNDSDVDASWREQSRTIWTRWLEWAQRNRARHRVAMLLHQSGLVSERAVTAIEAAFATPQQALLAAELKGELVDLPIE